MKKTTKKSWMIVSALSIGMAVFTPHQAEATTAKPTNEITVKAEQQIKGTIKSVLEDSITIKGKDGKNYYIGIQKFSDEQIAKMKLVEGQEISVEGSLVEDYSDFYTFDVYKKSLPKEITKEDLAKLEKMFNQMKKLEKGEKYDELDKIIIGMDKIIKPYFLASWVPESFEKVLEDYGFSDKNIVIKENDKKQLKDIYQQWIKLQKSGKEEKAQEKFDEFQKILQPYLDALYPPVTFEQYISDMELNIPAEAMPKLKTIYKDAQKADKEKNDQLSEKLWNDFNEMINPYTKPLSFEDYLSNFDFEIKATDKKQLKKLYEEAIALDKKGDSEKSSEKWAAIDKILKPYYEANKEILISASKVTINGKVYLTQHK
ncbi:hypothetical protein AMS59_07515 [Lysinibacillus sp. FJAT-14745]|uniref:hypothetical protein n=1 Tax=Lysinibacillus sp. FJAT-14745 TaxID=1704289 RepID=UPI0006ABEA76|nr:hypothetical protein [Lysinibacillus sp. FJAT-14745]KOP78894.1 hypothetical protein AMS59_07515 [Lysinibacillus sp. FJAT-14745]